MAKSSCPLLTPVFFSCPWCLRWTEFCTGRRLFRSSVSIFKDLRLLACQRHSPVRAVIQCLYGLIVILLSCRCDLFGRDFEPKIHCAAGEPCGFLDIDAIDCVSSRDANSYCSDAYGASTTHDFSAAEISGTWCLLASKLVLSLVCVCV